MKPIHIVLILIIALCAIVLIQNLHTSTIQFLVWSISLPQFLLTLLTLLVGFALGYLASVLTRPLRKTLPPSAS